MRDGIKQSRFHLFTPLGGLRVTRAFNAPCNLR
jgi:hypothetical protein